ncbi:hypothetical protein REPUB_Repub08aG0074300 [Reevesia pubescens]
MDQDPSIQEASNESRNNDEQSTTSRKKGKKRGKTMLPKVWKAPSGQKFKVEYNHLGQPVGDNSSTFTSFCGVVTRSSEVAPLNYDHWDQMPSSFKDKQLTLLKKYFEFSDMLRPWINASIGRKWRDYKGELKAKYYDQTLSIEANIANLPPDVPVHQWIHLVNYFESPIAKKLAKLGAQGRKCQKALHTSGSKSFARKKHQMEHETRRTIGAVEFYVATHQHKDGRFVDDEARTIADKARRELSDLHVDIESSSEDSIRSQQEVMSRVRGKEHCGRVRGLGLGPTPTQVFGSSRFSANMFTQSSQEFDRMKTRIVELEAQVATIPLLEARMDSLMAIIRENFPNINAPSQPQNNTNENVTNIVTFLPKEMTLMIIAFCFRYKESELNMGENSCIDRCVSKYWQVGLGFKVNGMIGQMLSAGGRPQCRTSHPSFQILFYM